MSGASHFTIAPRVRRFAITIPASSGTAANLYDLIKASLTEEDKPNIIGGIIADAPAAYVAGDSTTSLPVAVAVGEKYEEPCANFIYATYVKAATDATINVGLSVWLLGDGRA